MPLLAALWLALVHLVAAAPAPRLAGAAEPGVGVVATLSRQETAPGDRAIRAPRPLPALGALRADGPRGHAPPPHGAAPTPRSHDTVVVVAESRAARQPSHAPAARGGVLPYFPTAPPLQG